MSSRAWAVFALALAATPAGGLPSYDPVVPGVALQFPRDRGAHPGHRIEWWYVTGRLEDPAARDPASRRLGFQITFFRVRNLAGESLPGRFSPGQILFAHAALADPALGRLLRADKAARVLDGLVEAKQGETDVRLDDWVLARRDGRYDARIAAADFTLELTLRPTQPVMPQGEAGFSRKGPEASHASYYYSEPHLAVVGRVESRGARREVKGVAWLDHEWSSTPLAQGAAGWDWLGVNLADGGALMAFRIRGKDGSPLYSHARWRAPGRAQDATGEARFRTLRTWTSPRTGITYPVAVEVQAAGGSWRVEPILDDQELDARASSGVLYWEGAVDVRSGSGLAGTGYLELTGYGARVPF